MRPLLALTAVPLLLVVLILIANASLPLGISAQVNESPEADRYPIMRGDKLGFIDASGREVVAPQFGTAGDTTRFREGMANVYGNGSWGYVDGSGRFVIEPKFWWTYPFSEGLACVLLPGAPGVAGYGFVDKTGRLLIHGLKAQSEFHDGLAPVLIDEKWGYLGTDMKLRIPAQFQFAAPFSGGLAAVKLDHRWGYIDKTGTVVIRPKYDLAMAFHDGLGRVKVSAGRTPMLPGVVGMEGQTTEAIYLWGFVDRDGREAIAPGFLELTDFSEGHAFAKSSDGKNALRIIDNTGRFVSGTSFDEATAFSESLAAVRVGEKWGYVDHSGSWVILPRFTHAEPFWHGLASVVFDTGQSGYLDHNGSVVWQDRPE